MLNACMPEELGPASLAGGDGRPGRLLMAQHDTATAFMTLPAAYAERPQTENCNTSVVYSIS